MLSIAFGIFVVVSAFALLFLQDKHLAAPVLVSGSVFLVGLGLAGMFRSAGYCGTMLFRTLTIYVPSWALALSLIRLVAMADGNTVDSLPTVTRVPGKGVLIVAVLLICIVFNFGCMLGEPMSTARSFEYNGQQYVGTLIGLSTDPVIYDDLGPLVCREVDLPYDSPLYHELAHAYWEAR